MPQAIHATRLHKRSRAGRPSVAEAALRTEAVLQTALEVFTEMGYQRAGMEEIARRAQVSKQTLYARFPGKADLFRAIIHIVAEEVHKHFAAVLEPNADLRSVLLRYAENLFDLASSSNLAAIHRIVIGAFPEFPELAEEFWNCAKCDPHPLGVYLQSQVEQGLLRIDDTQLAAHFFDGLCVAPMLVMLSTLEVRPKVTLSQLHAQFQEAIRVFLAAYGLPSELGPALPSGTGRV